MHLEASLKQGCQVLAGKEKPKPPTLLVGEPKHRPQPRVDNSKAGAFIRSESGCPTDVQARWGLSGAFRPPRGMEPAQQGWDLERERRL